MSTGGYPAHVIDAALELPASVEAVGASSTTGAGLKPTGARLRLTAGVAAREVHYYIHSGDSYWNGRGNGLMVTKRMAELEAAGWVEKGPTLDGGPVRLWVLTDIAPAVTS